MNLITQALRALANKILGSRVPRTFTISDEWRRGNAHEYDDAAVRAPQLGNQLIDIVTNCWAASHGLSMVANDVFTGSDPDESGVIVEAEPRIKAVLDKVTRSFDRDNYIRIVERLLGYGDAFVELGFDTKSTQPSINNAIVLPTWEMFRVEESDGTIECFEQRKYSWTSASLSPRTTASHSEWASTIIIPPWKVLHFRFNPKYLYGQSPFEPLIPIWQQFREVSNDIAIATRGTGLVPNVFTMPEWADENYKAAFKNDYQERLKAGAVTDVFLNHGMTVTKLSNGAWNPDIKAMREAYELYKQEFYVALNIPLYLAGLQIKGAAEIARAPQQNYERFIFNIQSIILDEMRKACDLQLALHLVDPIKSDYKLRMPRYSFSGWGSLEAPDEDNNYSDQSITKADGSYAEGRREWTFNN